MDKKTEDIKREIRTEIEDDIKGEIKDELKEELRDEIKEKMKEEIKGDIQGIEEENIRTDKSLYVEGLGMYRLIKDNLQTASEAAEIIRKVENGEYGIGNWYKHVETNNTYSVWQRYMHYNNMNDSDKADCERIATHIVRDASRNATKDSTVDTTTVEACCEYNTGMIHILIASVSFGYVIGGAMYLKHVLHVEPKAMVLYSLVVIIVALLVLWLHCEFRECSE